MLGPFPTWFQIRERGKQYALAVRWEYYPTSQDWHETYDVQEQTYLDTIHQTLCDRCNINQNSHVVDTQPEYVWNMPSGYRYSYLLYPIPFGWRQPFLEWLNGLVGPDGVCPVRTDTSHPPREDNSDNPDEFDFRAHWTNRFRQPNARRTAPRRGATVQWNTMPVATPTGTAGVTAYNAWVNNYIVGYTGTGNQGNGNNGGTV